MIDTTSQLTLFGGQEVSSINKADLSNKSNQANQANQANQNNQNNQIFLPSGKTELRDYQKDIKKQCYDLIKAGTKRICSYRIR
jgi:HSP90 family molecular chaperone